jgi:hypothetical protein
MINFRYHIISITAVFLALGIGLAMGTAFIDKATVDGLERQLDSIEGQNNNLAATNDELRAELETDGRLFEQAGPQLLAPHLADVPVLIIAARGIDEDAVDAASAAVGAAGARLGGTLWLTRRLLLDDADERSDLATILGLGVDPDDAAGADRLHRSLSARLGALLAAAGAPDPSGDAGTDPTPPPEPELLVGLRNEGFVELEAPPTDPGFAVLPERGVRYVVVSGSGAAVPDELVLLPTLGRLVANDPVPVVAAVPSPDDEQSDADAVDLVTAVRENDELRQLVSTVDNLETFAGRVAVVLTLEHAGVGQVGHYGVADGAEALVPPPVSDG